jgi:hypothetical protein
LRAENDGEREAVGVVGIGFRGVDRDGADVGVVDDLVPAIDGKENRPGRVS